MSTDLPNFSQLLREYGIQPKKSLGQNFLFDPNIINQIIDLAGITPGMPVLEIGAGPGNLTQALAARAGRVVAVELDRRFLPLLEQARVRHPNLEIIHANILDLDLDTLMGSPDYIVVANLPYYITSAVIRKLLETHHKPTRLVLTVQKEVANRICAKAGELSLLAVSVQVYGQPHLGLTIPAGAFYPSPKVDSAVVVIKTHPIPLLPAKDLAPFFRMVKAGFSQKRKMLRNTLSAGLRMNVRECEALLLSAGIDPARRAQTLELSEWVILTTGFVRQKSKMDA